MAKTELGKEVIKLIEDLEKWVKAGVDLKKSLEKLKKRAKQEKELD